MTQTFKTLDKVAKYLASALTKRSDKAKIMILYAFNGVGKTRLSTMMQENLVPETDSGKIETLSYNAFFEDFFVWDNDNLVLSTDPKHSIIKLINDQGLEGKITENFQKLTLLKQKIEPISNWSTGKTTFGLSSSDDDGESIKISRGEESLFVWSVFYTVLDAAISALNDSEEGREIKIFNDLKYIIIDDPVSSIDDTKIITMAMELTRTIKNCKNANLNFLITTHHALFFNVLRNEYSRSSTFKPFFWLLSKNLIGYDTEYKIEKLGDSPFAYHLTVKNEIQNAIDNQEIKKYHFNLFRGLLEKNANFLGYATWSDCIEDGEKRQEIIRLLNLYSHGKLSDLESTNFSDEQKDLLKQVFEEFIKEYKWQP